MLEVPGYTVLRVVHETSNSIIQQATRDADGATVFLKTLAEDLPSPARIARMRREYEITQRVSGEGVVAAVALERVGARLVMVLEDFGGTAVARAVEGGELSLPMAVEICEKTARALARIHANRLIHKDINPGNIAWNQQSGEVKILDFGIATELSRERPEVLSPSVLEGTLAFMSPEQTGRMNRALDYRTDLYSLGATLYRLATGKLPFPTDDAMELVHCHIARTPLNPSEANPRVPAGLSAIIVRLLAKNAEDRYQSAFAVAEDLAKALAFLKTTGHVPPFELGVTDLSDRFQLPQKLYGRDGERRTLLAAFDRVAAGGREMLLVAGYSGIGKSALVHEVHRPIVERRGQFVEGKFDQFNRNIPYASLIQAFRELVKQLLTEPAEVLADWREKVQHAVGPNGQVIVDVISEVELIIGEQEPVAPLPAAEALNRFNIAFESFVRTFASAEHPLTLFLDDLQWADLPSLKLMTRFMTDPQTRHILLIGAYRDNEVGEGHQLLLTLDAMRKASATIDTITLAPLDAVHVGELLQDTLLQPAAAVSELTALCMKKTGGNPFFLSQFLMALFEGGSIDFDPGSRTWTWDTDKIEAMGITDNVVELMARKIRSLGADTQAALRVAAALGASFDLRTLSIALECTPLAAARGIAEALREGLVNPVGSEWKFLDGSLDPGQEAQAVESPGSIHYRFLHDRVQQASYSMIPEDQLPAEHLRIGRLLFAASTAEERQERLFEIVNHLAFGGHLVTDPVERKQLAQLNLQAGIRAKTSAAFKPAVGYLQAGIELVGSDIWETDYELALELHVHATESTYQTADYELMEQYADLVNSKARDLLDRVLVAEIRIQAYISQLRLQEAVDSALVLLGELGVTFPAEPTDEDVGAAIGATATAIGGRSPDELYELPEMQDPYKLAAMRVLQKITSASYVARPALFPLVPMKGAELSATLGNTAASTYAYACYGIILAGVTLQIDEAYGMGQLAVRLVDKFQAREYEARTKYIEACYVRHWCRHSFETWQDFAPIYQIGLDTGDLEFAGWALMMGSFHAFYSGRPLNETEPETARWIGAISQVGQAAALHPAEAGWQAMRCLRGLSAEPTRLADPEYGYDQDTMLETHIAGGDAFGVSNLLFNRMLLCTLFGDYEQARSLADQLEPWFPAMVSLIHVPTVVMTDSLFRIELARGGADDADALIEKVTANLGMLTKWAHHAPMNHLHKQLLIEGQLARYAGDVRTAREKLKASAEAAGSNENLFGEALALEMLGRLWLEDEHEPEMAEHILRRSHHGYTLWGAKAKAAELEQRFGAGVLSGQRLRAVSATTTQMSTLTTGQTQTRTGMEFDLGSVVKANQTLSGEMELTALLGKMMDIVLENGGAEYGALLLDDEGQLRLEARDVADTPGVTVLESMPLDRAVSHRLVPGSIINYVARTRESVVLDDASASGRFTQDPYVRDKNARSVLCSPLLHQGKLVGVLYLENNLSPGAFTEDRIEVLDLLVGQSAVALDNARLFDQQKRLAESFARFVPQQFLQLLGRQRLLDVELGDSVQEDFTVMFTDLRGFTTLSENLSAEENFKLLNDYLARMGPVIESNHGFIDKYIGDAIMALFPDPADAVNAAVGMQEALEDFNALRRGRGEAELRMGIGIHTGQLMLGTVGSHARMETTVIGDTVNLASRLEGMTKQYGARILISEESRAQLPDQVPHQFRSVGRVQVKGKSNAVQVHEVIDGEPARVRDLKLGTRPAFARACTDYFVGSWTSAAEGFRECLDVAPEDGAARFYLTRAMEYIAGERTLTSVDGVEVLEVK